MRVGVVEGERVLVAEEKWEWLYPEFPPTSSEICFLFVLCGWCGY